MCAVTELGCRAKEFTNALLADGYITGDQYPTVLAQVQEQMALTTAAMMAEVRLRTNAILSERAIVDQISREIMVFIGSRQVERGRQRKKVQEAFQQMRAEVMAVLEQNSTPFIVVQRPAFCVRYPEFQPAC